MSANPFDQQEKLFSIVTPVYAKAWQTFPKFFQALAEQQYKSFEVIIAFDGPNKKGEKELEKIRQKYPKMVIKQTVNEWAGAPAARNHGAKRADGDYLTFLDPDVYLYSDTLRYWADQLEANPWADVVWGLYDIVVENQRIPIGGSVPKDNAGRPIYWAFRFSNYCSGAFPIRRGAFVGWDESVKSLQDWDMWVRMLKADNFEGKNFLFCDRSFFMTENVREGGISHDSHTHWLERVKYIKEKNGIPLSDTVVTSLGAPFHGVNAAKQLGADYLPDPWYKPNEYRKLYLLGFYAAGIENHLRVMAGPAERSIKRLIHWIGTDIYQLQHSLSVATFNELKQVMKRDRWVNLTEAPHTYLELRDLGLKTKVVPIPPSQLFAPLPLPKDFTVAIYENPYNKMYHEDLMKIIVRSMPDVQFLFFGDDTKKGQKGRNYEHLGWVEIEGVLKLSSCNLRVTQHDGLPLTPLQFLTAGRQVVTNVPLWGTIQTKVGLPEIMAAIRAAKHGELNPKVGRYWHKVLDVRRFKKAISRI
jgi:glycosyltransferase involved in cell wall biosynthesis